MQTAIRVWQLLAILVGVCGFPVGGHAQQPPGEKESATPAFIEDARKYVIESTMDRAKLKLNEKSLLNWTNPVRQQERACRSLWHVIFESLPKRLSSSRHSPRSVRRAILVEATFSRSSSAHQKPRSFTC